MEHAAHPNIETQGKIRSSPNMLNYKKEKKGLISSKVTGSNIESNKFPGNGAKNLCVKILPQVHGAGRSQQRQVRVVSAGNLYSNTRTDFFT